MIKIVKKYLFFSIGIILTILGIIGAFLPVMPTTPFILAALYFFSKSSDKMHNWILTNKTFGPAIKVYYESKTLNKKTKYKAISFLWFSILLSCYILYPKIIHIILLIIIAIFVTIWIISIPSKKEGYYDNTKQNTST